MVSSLFFGVNSSGGTINGGAQTNKNLLAATQQFKSGEDYLNRMREFDHQIKANYPGARTTASMSNTANKAIDEDFKTFPDPNWDAVGIHKFGGDGDTLELSVHLILTDRNRTWK